MLYECDERAGESYRGVTMDELDLKISHKTQDLTVKMMRKAFSVFSVKIMLRISLRFSQTEEK